MTILNMHVYSRVDDPEHFFLDHSDDMTWLGYVYVCPVTVEFPDPDPAVQLPKHIKGLNDKKRELMAKTQSELNQLDDVIQKLLCISAPAQSVETSASSEATDETPF